jgi:fatty acid desaturase
MVSLMSSAIVEGLGADGPSYSDLLNEVRAANLMRPRRAYYGALMAVDILGLGLGWLLFVLSGRSWLQIAVAIWIAFFFGQCAIMGHSVGHQQISRSRKMNFVLGYLFLNACIGMSYDWWLDRHNRHHAHPNDEARDPDINNALMVYTASQLRKRHVWRRHIAIYQAALYLPGLFLLQGFAMRFNAIRYLATSTVRGRLVELILLAGHLAAYCFVVLSVLSPWQAIGFASLQTCCFGTYMGLIIAPNHKGMPIVDSRAVSDAAARQIVTTRNISGGYVMEWVYGGLNYQIEHHLFPSMPIPGLRRARQLVVAFCEQRELPYTEMGLLASYRESLSYMNAVGRLPT